MAALHITPPDHDLELLSAYLDGELSDHERISLEQRLSHESDLRTVLDDLRETIAMVRDLPTLKAPRNFTLDPAIYNRPAPWWKQLFTLNNVLQLSGAVGAIAAIMIIVSAFMLSSDTTGDEANAPETAFEQAGDMQPGNAAEPNIAMQATVARTMTTFDTATLSMTSTAPLDLQATAIANSNTDAVAFDQTLEAQSVMYASTEMFGTMTAESVGLEASAAQANAMGEGIEEATAEEDIGFAAGGDTNNDADYAPAEAEAHDSAYDGVDGSVDDDASDDGALGAAPPPQPQAIYSTPQPEGPVMLEVSPPVDEGAPDFMIVTAEPAPDMADSASAPAAADTTSDMTAADDAMREPEATASQTTVPVAATALPTQTSFSTPSPAPTQIAMDNEGDSSGGMMASVTETSEVYAPQESTTDELEQLTDGQPAEIETVSSERKDARQQDNSNTITWLVGLGAIVLVASLAVFVVGRRRS